MKCLPDSYQVGVRQRIIFGYGHGHSMDFSRIDSFPLLVHILSGEPYKCVPALDLHLVIVRFVCVFDLSKGFSKVGSGQLA